MARMLKYWMRPVQLLKIRNASGGRGILGLTTIIIYSLCGMALAAAGEYPSKPIQLIIAFPPGGGADNVARIMVNKLSSVLGQQVIVVNKAGGGGVIGTTLAKAAVPDGYTVFMAAPPMLRHPLTTKGVTYDLVRDFIPINLPVSIQMVTVVKFDSTLQSFKELIAAGKKDPGKLTYSSNGYGSTGHFAMETLKMETGADFTHLPMDGTGPQIVGVLGGHVNMTVVEVGLVNKHLEAKTLRALVIWGRKRHKLFPDIPTTAEEGFPNLQESSWQAFFVPLKTPEVIVNKLEKAFKQTLNDKEIIQTFEKAGWVIENFGSKETSAFLANCQKNYVDVANAVKMVPK